MANPRPIINVSGERVALGPLRRDLVPLYQAWINNLESQRFLAAVARPMTLDEEFSWFEAVIRDRGTNAFTIYGLPDHRPIGLVNLHKVDQAHRTCELGIMIGEPSERAKGHGTEAVKLAVDFAFYALNLHSVMLETFEYNHAGYRAYRRAGFREIGRRRQARFHAGRFWDVILMDVLRDEFESPILARTMAPDANRD